MNISAVGTSITLTLMPVSSSHFGPEKFSGSSDCSPASQTIVIVVPAYFFAAATARPAAVSAMAALATLAARTAESPRIASRFLLLTPMSFPPKFILPDHTTGLSAVHMGHLKSKLMSQAAPRP